MATKTIVKFATYFDKDSWIINTGTENIMESLTDQSFKSMTEIEQLIVNYRGTPRTPVYDMENYDTADWTFEDWQNQKATVERKFLHLSPEVQAQFKTPAEFFKYCSNPQNYELTVEGVVEKPQEPIKIDTPTVVPELPKE